MTYFAEIHGAPELERLLDMNPNDIITFELKGEPIFCKIIKDNKLSITVAQLEMETENNTVRFTEMKDYINHIIRNNLRKTRKIYKVTNVVYL